MALGAVAAVGLLSIGAAVIPASAEDGDDDAIVITAATPVCDAAAGNWVVTWTVENKVDVKAEQIHWVHTPEDSELVSEPVDEIGGEESVTVTQTVPGSRTAAQLAIEDLEWEEPEYEEAPPRLSVKNAETAENGDGGDNGGEDGGEDDVVNVLYLGEVEFEGTCTPAPQATFENTCTGVGVELSNKQGTAKAVFKVETKVGDGSYTQWGELIQVPAKQAVTKTVPGAAGLTVKVTSGGAEVKPPHTWTKPSCTTPDPNPNPTVSATPSPTPSPAATPSAAPAQPGGALPVTGANVSIMVLVGLGAVGSGLGVLLWMRRRVSSAGTGAI